MPLSSTYTPETGSSSGSSAALQWSIWLRDAVAPPPVSAPWSPITWVTLMPFSFSRTSARARPETMIHGYNAARLRSKSQVRTLMIAISGRSAMADNVPSQSKAQSVRSLASAVAIERQGFDREYSIVRSWKPRCHARPGVPQNDPDCASARHRPASSRFQRLTLNWTKIERIDLMRSRCSSSGFVNAVASAEQLASRS